MFTHKKMTSFFHSQIPLYLLNRSIVPSDEEGRPSLLLLLEKRSLLNLAEEFTTIALPVDLRRRPIIPPLNNIVCTSIVVLRVNPGSSGRSTIGRCDDDDVDSLPRFRVVVVFVDCNSILRPSSRRSLRLSPLVWVDIPPVPSSPSLVLFRRRDDLLRIPTTTGVGAYNDDDDDDKVLLFIFLSIRFDLVLFARPNFARRSLLRAILDSLNKRYELGGSSGGCSNSSTAPCFGGDASYCIIILQWVLLLGMMVLVKLLWS